MSDLILRQADIDRFTDTLKKLSAKASVNLAALIHRDGHLLASAGQTDTVDATALSALVSANFSSTIAVANLLGEKEFTTQHHAGRERSIFVSLVDEYAFLVSVFKVETPVEPIRLCAEEFRGELTSALEQLYKNEPDDIFASGDDLEEFSLGQYADAEDVARAEKSGTGAAQAIPRKLSYTGSGKAADVKEKQTTAPTASQQEKPRQRPPAPVAKDAPPAKEEPPSRSERPAQQKDTDDDADFEALAKAISSRKERETQKINTSQSKKAGKSGNKSDTDEEVMMVDGKRMNVVSLKKKGNKKQGT